MGGKVFCTLAWGGLAALSVAWSPAVAGEAPNLALGRHLAQECNACHGAATAGSAIPVIAGRPAAELVRLLKAYATGTLPDGRRANPAMASVAQSLDEAQMAAVAEYLAGVAGESAPAGRVQ